MVERYRKSDMYQSTEQELGQLWQRLEEREERGHGGRTPSAGYTSNVLWQVMSTLTPRQFHVSSPHLHMCQARVTVVCVW